MKLLRAAVKAGVAGEQHGEALRVLLADHPGDVVRRDGRAHNLARAVRRLQHPLRADDALRLANRPRRPAGEAVRPAHADAGQNHALGGEGDGGCGISVLRAAGNGRSVRVCPIFLFRLQPEPLGDFPGGFLEAGQARFPGGTADDHGLYAGAGGGAQLGRVAARVAGVLGDHPLCAGEAQHGVVHLLVEGALRRQNPIRLQAAALADIQRRAHGQHPGVQPLAQRGIGAEHGQFLASGGQKDVALSRFEQLGAGGGVRRAQAVAVGRAGGTQHAQIRRARALAGPAQVLRHQIGVGVRRVGHEIEPLVGEEALHRRLVHAPGVDAHALRGSHQLRAVIRGHADHQLRAAPGQPLGQPPPVGGSCENYDLAHA